MTLRLSSPSSSSKQGSSSIDGYLKQLHDDTSISLAQKNDCLKTLTVVLKNMIDPSKGGNNDGLKYRTLKIDNPKIQTRLFFGNSTNNNNYIKELLTDSSLIGMIIKENVLLMEETPSSAISDIIATRVMPAITTAQSKMASKLSTDSSNKKAKLSTIVHPLDKLSEKQKARILLEEKKRIEKEQDKLHRIATRRQIAADKLVRETDENWKPAVCAASAKTGQGLQSFRDRHGES